MSSDCELCNFRNPKGAVTAVIIQNGRLLMLKRSEEPFKGMWDLPGGYMQEMETPEQGILRELKEELEVKSKTTFIKCFPGYGYWKGDKFPIVSHAFLVEIQGEIKLNEENSAYEWVPLKEIESVAFDSNMDILKFLKEKFIFDLDRIRELVKQLDPSAEVKEQSLYKAVLGGYLATEYDNGILVGMGWAFPRQTLLRKQAIVEDMIVDESQRGKGLGYKVLNSVIQQAKADGVEVVELTTNPKREAANKLYQKYGFQLHTTNHYLYKVI
ncbi:MAG: NUDIX hydrolase [Candidatus Daviesbacteria bacterium GW2011_GWA2_38_24]|uniref:NUDIX hydrolase n=1 Tax=Candidatus Daviesbacteria bacterium GW2011_GWA2_38_24 TaxID=1618422 RepID=A0A0G0JTJ0_9BACT|nr:MAG: NUDIX hydrolase [Candidatus Daviesbacteria bacterium GW2011_GWA2_38_24]